MNCLRFDTGRLSFPAQILGLTTLIYALLVVRCLAQDNLSSNPVAVRFEKAKQADVAGDLPRALQGYLNLVGDDARNQYAVRSLFRAGELYTLKQDYTNAFACYQQLLDGKNEGDLFLKAVGNQFALTEKLIAVAVRNDSAANSPSSIKKAYEEATQMLHLILQTATQTDFAPRATFLLSALQAKMGQKEASRETLQSFGGIYPDHALAEDAEFQLAFCDYQDGIAGRGDAALLERAEQELTYFLTRRPKSDRLPVAKALLKDIARRQYAALRETALYYKKTGYANAAGKCFRDMVARFPDLVAQEMDADDIRRRAALPLGVEQ